MILVCESSDIWMCDSCAAVLRANGRKKASAAMRGSAFCRSAGCAHFSYCCLGPRFALPDGFALDGLAVGRSLRFVHRATSEIPTFGALGKTKQLCSRCGPPARREGPALAWRATHRRPSVYDPTHFPGSEA